MTTQLENKPDNQPTIDTTWILLEAEHDHEATDSNDGVHTMKVTFIRHGERDTRYFGFPNLPSSDYNLALNVLQSRRGCEVVGLINQPPTSVWIYFKKHEPWGVY